MSHSREAAGQTGPDPLALTDTVIAPNGSPHKTTRHPPEYGSPETKHRRYYARNRALVRARQKIAHQKRRDSRSETP